MTFVLEASVGLKALAEPRPSGDRIKTAIGRAARSAGLTYWRAFDLWYGKARRIDAAELEAIRSANQKQHQEEADLRGELQRVRAKLADIERRLAKETTHAHR